MINAQMHYKGYTGSIEFDGESWHGRIQKMSDIISYGCDRRIDLRKEFKEAVDNYIDYKKRPPVNCIFS